MTSSKSDLEAKEGQIPNESNFLEFVSLLGSLSTRAAGSSAQEERGPRHAQEAEAAEEGESQSRLFNCILARFEGRGGNKTLVQHLQLRFLRNTPPPDIMALALLRLEETYDSATLVLFITASF